MEEKKKYLEHHWILAQKELDQEKVLREKQQIESKEEFDRAVADEKEKYVRVEKDHEQRIADLKKAHAKQCDELCREILKANLEADRLHSQLKDNGVEPRKARLFTEGTSTGPNLPLIPIIGAVVLLVRVFFVREKRLHWFQVWQDSNHHFFLFYTSFLPRIFCKKICCRYLFF